MAFPPPLYRWRLPPWRGLEVDPDPPRMVHTYIDLTPFDLVKYEVDGKIIGVLENDYFWKDVQDISDLPEVPVERMKHYFSTYKLVPGEESQISIERAYNCDMAIEVVQAVILDYQNEFRC